MCSGSCHISHYYFDYLVSDVFQALIYNRLTILTPFLGTDHAMFAREFFLAFFDNIGVHIHVQR